MNDFETRARAAGRAIHDAVGVPIGGRRADRPSRGPIRALLIAAVVVVVTAIVGTAVLTHDESGTAADVATFCAEVQQMATRPLDGERHPESLAFLRDAPEEIRPTALAILRSRTQRQSSASIEDSQRFLLWWQTRCFPNAAMPGAGPADRRDAPAPAPTGFEPCGVNNGGSIGTPEQLRDEYGTITIYGDRRRADPYAGRTIGIVRSSRQRYYSDDHAEPRPIAGHPDAEVIDATGPFGAAIEGLGPAITWKDDHSYVSVVGRGWSRTQAGELEGIAARVVAGPNGDELTDPERDGLDVLYRGPVGDVYVQYPSPIAATTFSISYTTPRGGGVRLYGSAPASGAAAATRFFAPTIRPETIGGRDVLEGVVPVTNTPDGTTSRVVVWTDGAVMLTMTFDPQHGPTPADLDAFVRATRPLDRAEWEQRLREGNACLVAGRGDSASASGSVSSTGSSTTSLGSTASPGSSSTSSTTVTTLGR
jgi:hypothetical protein